MSATTIEAEGQALRSRALQKLQQARDLIDSARGDLCNLEGAGYDKNYQALYPLYEKVGAHMAKIRALKPPTGVFKW